MSFGFSLSDFVTAHKLASELYRTCFTEAERADIKYIQFGGEIKSLRDSVKQLYDVISNAENQRPRPWHRRDADQHINNPNMKALSQVTGDFLQTLQECERLLKDNSKFERGAAGFVNNVIWHSSTERKVNTLKQRVHFHQTKISFIAKPFETQLLLGIQQELKEIRRDVAVLKGILINDTAWASGRESLLSSEESSPIPQDLALRFKQGLSINSPGAFRVGDDLPLQEGFDALIFHFASSTVNFNANLGLGQNIPEEPQYLNLLKSKWILDRLRESANFQSVEQESLWGEYMRELEGEIRYEYSRFQNRDLFAPSFEVLSRLPDSCFNIWVDEGSLRYPAALTEEQPFEEKILELDLNSPHPSRQSTLTIFRKSDITFRLVTTTKDEQNADLHREESEDVNMGEIRLIPTFATSEGGSNPNNNVLLYGNYSQPKCYTLCSSSDVSRFQHALMGFRVSHNMSDVKWCIEYHNYLKPGLSGKARLQLWQVKPLIKKSPQEFSPAGSRTTRSAHSPSESANLRRFWTSGTSQRPGTTLVSPVIGANGDGVALLYPEPPVLVLFTECEKRYSILHLQLEEHIAMAKQPCVDCRKQTKPCSRVLITVLKKSSKNLSLRRLRAEQEREKGLKSWDLACFRYPEHPRFNKLELLSRVKYLSLHFVDENAGNEFCEEFKALETLRDMNLLDYQRELREAKFAANNIRSPK